MQPKKIGFIQTFIEHKVASNLLMLAMIVLGLWGYARMNNQFFPNFSTQTILVVAPWTSARPENVETSLVQPIEKAIHNVKGLKEINATAFQGAAHIQLKFNDNADLNEAMNDVKDQIALVSNLPKNADKIEVQKIDSQAFQPIASIIVSGPNYESLRRYAKELEDQLLIKGISKIGLEGINERIVAVEVSSETLRHHRLNLTTLANQISLQNNEGNAGNAGLESNTHEIGSQALNKTIAQLSTLPIITHQKNFLALGDIASIKNTYPENAIRIEHNNQPAINMILYRSGDMDTLKAASIMQSWLKEAKNNAPEGTTIESYNEVWKLLKGRLDILVENGLQGLALVLLFLFIFLDHRAAFWVSTGIPVALAGSMLIFYLVGGSINMISLFAFIMTLGIIVDDNIVVSEEILSQHQHGKPIKQAITEGTYAMLTPVVASSLTTIFAFIPLLIVRGAMGEILADIPKVVIAVLLASLVECFLILPAHLKHAFQKKQKQKNNSFRTRFDTAFERFKDQRFKPFLSTALTHYPSTILITVAGFTLTLALLISGRVNFTFFPEPEGTTLWYNATFIQGTPDAEKTNILKQSEQALYAAVKKIQHNTNSTDIIQNVVRFKGESPNKGSNPLYAAIIAEISAPDERHANNQAILDAWRTALKPSGFINNLQLSEPKAGPPGSAINIALSGPDDLHALKKAATTLKQALKQFSGVSNIEDNLQPGPPQWLFSLKPTALALGISTADINTQLRTALTGLTTNTFYEEEGKVTIQVRLPKSERNTLSFLKTFPIETQSGFIPLENITTWRNDRGFQSIQHQGLQRTVTITADVDTTRINTNKVLAELQQKTLPELKKNMGVRANIKGKAEDEQNTIRDMKYGLLMGLILIFITLAWISESYVWPWLLMLILPFGLAGAIVGHWIMGYDITILSLFGLFGLSGIMLNDSIVLLMTFKRLVEQYKNHKEAILHAACQRLRAVLLTSLTTIFGLMPLLFEHSVQARFLIPMAISITFGLVFSTVLILIFVPAIIAAYDDLKNRASKAISQSV